MIMCSLIWRERKCVSFHLLHTPSQSKLLRGAPRVAEQSSIYRPIQAFAINAHAGRDDQTLERLLFRALDHRFQQDGGAAPVDYNRPFKQSEVTQKARITFKPEPGFTEGARKFRVSGTVLIEAILAATGEVKNISVVIGLPHGLTWKALDALRKVKFEPAQKDGHVVSQYAVFEYDFNIY